MKLKKINFNKAWEVIKTHEHMSPETRDRLALLAGFQSWEELQKQLLEEQSEK